MRKKLYIGLFVMAVVGIVAGERLFNRLRGAQDPAKKAEAAQTKDAAPVFPPLTPSKDDTLVIPAPAPNAIQPPPMAQYGGTQDPKPATLEFPPMKPTVVPPPPIPVGTLPSKPPVVEEKKAEPGRYDTPVYPKPAFEVQVDPKKDDKDPPTVTLPPSKPPVSAVPPVPPAVEFGSKPTIPAANPLTEPGTKRTALTTEEIAASMKQVQELIKEHKFKEAEAIVDRVRAADPDYLPAMAAKRIIETRLAQEKYDPDVKPIIKHTPTNEPLPNITVAPSAAVAQHLEKLKNSPWSLHIELADGQTIVTATVNKKHAFKVVCQNLDVSTGKHMLKATGKVTLSGDMMTGHCETLGIALLDDRLILEGGADVRIQKTGQNVSDNRPTTFELKGETLNLRISDLQAAKLVSGDWRQVSNSSGLPVRPASNPAQNGKWSQWGVLRRLADKSKIAGETVWSLEDQRGTPIVLLVARDGGTLAQYEGRRISVFGATEQIASEAMLRVSHIALP